jgi:hypothetical protein
VITPFFALGCGLRTSHHHNSDYIQQHVRVTRPTKRTLLDSRTKAVHVTPLVAATEGEREKHALHDAGCLRQGWQNTPFVMETYGAYGSDATKLLATMAEHAVDRTPGDFLAHARSLLSVALQSGNARVAALGTQELHTRTYRRMCGGPRGDDLPHHEQPAAQQRDQQRRARLSTVQLFSETYTARCAFKLLSTRGIRMVVEEGWECMYRSEDEGTKQRGR